MASEWPTMSLREAGISLIDCEHRTPPASEYGYPYVAIPQVKDGRIHLDGVRRITRKHFDEWTSKAAPESFDIVLSRRCNPGETGFVSEGLKFALGQNLVLLRSDGTKVFKPFLRWLVRGPRWWDQVGVYINVGAVFDSLKCGDIPGFRLPIPPLSEQRAIAPVLGTLDDKIELNRRMNETLEAMVRALFKSWFVDFEPVRAKMAGRDTGLPEHLADLFPDRLVESELGEIPEGWEVESLEMIAQLEKATVKPEGHATEEFEHFSLPAYDSGQLPALDLGSTIKSNKTLVPSQAVLLSKLNPEIQRVWLPASASSRRQISSTEFLVFTPKPPIGRAGLYALFNTQSFRDLLKGMVTGTSKSHQRVAPKSLVTQGMISPADILTNDFEALAWPMLERTLRNKSENHTLAALRDTLLPKLISGELRSKQVEAIA